MTPYFITITGPGDKRLTVTREAEGAMELMDALAAEFPGMEFDWSDLAPLPSGDIEAQIKRDIIDSMDLPDGAWLQMHEDFGVEIY